ncbi:MAG: flagellar hook-basal body complex protein FliE [Acidimicrobiales bacterium]
MSFPTPPVAPVRSSPVSPAQGPDSFQPGLTPGVQPTEQNGGFAKAITDALDTISGLENAVDRAGQQAATGDLNSVSDYMIATSEAQLATEITVAIRDRAIAAFNDIMRMQI